MSAGPARRWRAVVDVLRGRREAVLLGLAALLVAATLFRPGFATLRPQIDAVAVIDITQSMNVPDQSLGGKPLSRLAFAKAAVDGALARLPCGSRLGLAIFTEYRALLLLAPLEVCEHQTELRNALRRIDGRMAWAGASEVAKGINSGMEAMRALPEHPALLFLTDGHESPPVNPGYRPYFTVARGEVRGLIVGVGGDVALPIPKFDPDGHPAGEWAAADVMQVDPRSVGRGGSVSGEQMVDPDEAKVPPLPGATPGREHLSSLREEYLRLIANETGLQYQRLVGAVPLAAALADSRLARDAPARVDLRPALAGAALLCMVWPLLPLLWRRRRPRHVNVPPPRRPSLAAQVRATRPLR